MTPLTARQLKLLAMAIHDAALWKGAISHDEKAADEFDARITETKAVLRIVRKNNRELKAQGAK